MAIEIRPTRKFIFSDTDSKLYEVIIKQTAADAASGVARQIGLSNPATPSLSRMYSTPSYALTEQTFVVITTKVPTVMSPETSVPQLCVGAFYHATDVEGTGAALATLLS